MINVDIFRPDYNWKIEVTEDCIYHIDIIYEADEDIMNIIAGTRSRYLKIADLLDFDFSNEKKKEKAQKFNYWFFAPKLISDVGMTPTDDLKVFGQVTSSGIDYVVNNDKWSNHIEQIHHEEVHLLVSNEIGEAPPLFNEGIATYTENMIYKGKDESFTLYADIWNKHMPVENGLIKKLMINDYFWSVYGKLPLYTIGAAVVFFIVEKYSLDLLKEIFNSTLYEDDQFAQIVESKIGMSVDDIETDMMKYYLRL